MAGAPRTRILAIASSGGHWTQLRRLGPAFDGHDVAYASTNSWHLEEVGSARFYVVSDINRGSKLALLICAFQIGRVLVRERPHVLVSTGAAPGYLAIRLAKPLRIRTIWIDSVANVEDLSLSGRLASRKADLCLTQWPHLAGGRVSYRGSVL